MNGWLEIFTLMAVLFGLAVLSVDAAKGTELPKWSEVSRDLSHLNPLILPQLQKAMCFLVEDEGSLHAALIVRAPWTEFRGPVDEATPMRLHIDFFSGPRSDVFALYPIIYDDPVDPFFKETWLSPYERAIGPPDPLAERSRERLKLLLSQSYVRTLVVDENDRIAMVRTIEFTEAQKERHRRLARRLDDHAGETISSETYIEGLRDYLNAVPLSELQSEFVALLQER